MGRLFVGVGAEEGEVLEEMEEEEEAEAEEEVHGEEEVDAEEDVDAGEEEEDAELAPTVASMGSTIGMIAREPACVRIGTVMRWMPRRLNSSSLTPSAIHAAFSRVCTSV